MSEPLFIGFHVDQHNDDRRTPLSIERDREEAQGLAIQRVLGLGVTDGGIATVEQHKLTDEDFAKLHAMLEDFAAEHGLVKAPPLDRYLVRGEDREVGAEGVWERFSIHVYAQDRDTAERRARDARYRAGREHVQKLDAGRSPLP